MDRDFVYIIVNEMTDPVVRDAAELGPFPQCPNRWLTPWREYPAGAKSGDVGKRISVGASWVWRFHTVGDGVNDTHVAYEAIMDALAEVSSVRLTGRGEASVVVTNWVTAGAF